jgi:hypothetical protein
LLLPLRCPKIVCGGEGGKREQAKTLDPQIASKKSEQPRFRLSSSAPQWPGGW